MKPRCGFFLGNISSLLGLLAKIKCGILGNMSATQTFLLLKVAWLIRLEGALRVGAATGSPCPSGKSRCLPLPSPGPPRPVSPAPAHSQAHAMTQNRLWEEGLSPLPGARFCDLVPSTCHLAEAAVLGPVAQAGVCTCHSPDPQWKVQEKARVWGAATSCRQPSLVSQPHVLPCLEKSRREAVLRTAAPGCSHPGPEPALDGGSGGRAWRPLLPSCGRSAPSGCLISES